MNLSSWVDWGNKMLYCFENLPEKMKEAYSFILDNKDLIEELQAVVSAVRRVENICKTDGFSLATCKKCKDYIVCHVIGNTNNRRAMLGIEILEYFKKQEAILVDAEQNHFASFKRILSHDAYIAYDHSLYGKPSCYRIFHYACRNYASVFD